MTCRATDILATIVEAEDAGLLHAEACPICLFSTSKTECPVAMELVMQSVGALLEAKVFLDEERKRHTHDHDNTVSVG